MDRKVLEKFIYDSIGSELQAMPIKAINVVFQDKNQLTGLVLPDRQVNIKKIRSKNLDLYSKPHGVTRSASVQNYQNYLKKKAQISIVSIGKNHNAKHSKLKRNNSQKITPIQSQNQQNAEETPKKVKTPNNTQEKQCPQKSSSSTLRKSERSYSSVGSIYSARKIRYTEPKYTPIFNKPAVCKGQIIHQLSREPYKKLNNTVMTLSDLQCTPSPSFTMTKSNLIPNNGSTNENSHYNQGISSHSRVSDYSTVPGNLRSNIQIQSKIQSCNTQRPSKINVHSQCNQEGRDITQKLLICHKLADSMKNKITLLKGTINQSMKNFQHSQPQSQPQTQPQLQSKSQFSRTSTSASSLYDPGSSSFRRTSSSVKKMKPIQQFQLSNGSQSQLAVSKNFSRNYE